MLKTGKETKPVEVFLYSVAHVLQITSTTEPAGARAFC